MCYFFCCFFFLVVYIIQLQFFEKQIFLRIVVGPFSINYPFLSLNFTLSKLRSVIPKLSQIELAIDVSLASQKLFQICVGCHMLQKKLITVQRQIQEPCDIEERSLCENSK